MASPLAVLAAISYQDARPVSAGRESSTIISCGFDGVSVRGVATAGVAACTVSRAVLLSRFTL
jgi:hypothetical protein